jgi:L-lactate dehydrogenase complex protein LldF
MNRIGIDVKSALGNKRLQATLFPALQHSVESRDAVVSEVENWEELREHGRRVKSHTLERLPSYLESLEGNVIANGGNVLWAESGQEAVKLVLDIARDRGLRNVVKSKTMLGEEIHLNQGLQQGELNVVETDLGEYIIQLCDEMPSHIVTPALHKSRHEVAELFEAKLGIEATDDVAELTLTARAVLRKHFLEADLGISGVNFGIAETGTIVVVENEGNARLSTSLPRVHIALMGIEKVIPRTSDLAVFLKLLTRSATGQRLTSYINLISGPKREGELDGPDEFFLILVDNGRSKIYEDPFLRQTLTCIRCGACQNICPVFQRLGGHAYGTVYQGPIGSILTPQMFPIATVEEHPFTSSLCGACEETCPVKIEIPKILLRLRQQVQEARNRGIKRFRPERIGMTLWAWVMSSSRRYGFASRWLRRFQSFLHRKGKFRLAPPPVSTWQKDRDVPELAPKRFRDYREAGGPER